MVFGQFSGYWEQGEHCTSKVSLTLFLVIAKIYTLIILSTSSEKTLWVKDIYASNTNNIMYIDNM
jgi:hypothetical protein